MKKILKILLGVFVLFVIAGLFLGDPEDEEKEVKSEDTKETVKKDNDDKEKDNDDKEKEEDSLSNPYEGEKGKVYDVVYNRIKEDEYANAKFKEIKLNDDLSTENEDDYILLVYVDFDIKNSVETGNEVMRMYSDDLMANIAKKDIKSINESAIFWNDSYNDREIKYAYEYRDNNFYVTDVMGE